MSSSLQNRIASIRIKQGAISRKITLLESKAKAESRKLEAQQKYLVGAAVLAEMEKDKTFAARLAKLLKDATPREMALLAEALPDLAKAIEKAAAKKKPPALTAKRTSTKKSKTTGNSRRA